MPIIDPNISFPHFVSNQVLTANDLNSMVEYLDGQNRLSRVQIIGIGIVAGLEVSTETIINDRDAHVINVIKVSQGYGVTSMGFLFQFDEQIFDHVNLSVSVPESKFLCQSDVGQASSDDLSASIEVCELDKKDNVVEGGPFKEMSELDLLDDPNTDNENQINWRECFRDRVVVVCQEEQRTQRNACFNECDERGEDRRYQYRWLLVKKADMIRIWTKAFGASVGSEVQGKIVNLTKRPFIERLGFEQNAVNEGESKIDICGLTSWRRFYGSYTQSIESAIRLVSSAYEEALTEFEQAVLIENNKSLVRNLRSHLNDLFLSNYPQGGNLPKDCSDIQYLYDYLNDLILAYYEFEEVACNMDISLGAFEGTENNEAEFCKFPNYLALGLLEVDREIIYPGGIDDPGGTGDLGGDQFFTDCRTTNMGTGAQSIDQERLKLARFLFDRMAALADPLNITIPTSDLVIIKITPSESKGSRLSKRSIPFYYKAENVIEFWNPEASRCNRWQRIPNYPRLEYNLGINTEPNSINPFRYHLLYDGISSYDFYRIEGHIGQRIESAKVNIQEIRKQYNLPFDIQCIHLNGPFSNDLDGHTFDCRELDLLYYRVREELLCHIEEELSRINGRSDRVTKLLDQIRGVIEPTKTLADFEPSCTAFFLPSSAFNELYGDGRPYVDCYSETLQKLCEAFREKKTAFLERLMFDKFAAAFPGMEHRGGVVKGGTFVLVYVYALSSFTRQLLNSPESPGIPKWLLDLDKDSLTDEELIVEILRHENEEESIGFVKEIKKSFLTKVVADFCLPYYCCSQAPVVNFEVQLVRAAIVVEKTTFCSDEDVIEGKVSPPGGLFTSLPTGFTKNDPNGILEGFTFNPGAIADFDANGRKVLSLNYVFSGQTASRTFVVYNNALLEDIRPEDIICTRKSKCGDGTNQSDRTLIGFIFEFSLPLELYPGDDQDLIILQWHIKQGRQEVFLPIEGNVHEVLFSENIESFEVQVTTKIKDGPCKREEKKTILFCPGEEEMTFIINDDEENEINPGEGIVIKLDGGIDNINIKPSIKGGSLNLIEAPPAPDGEESPAFYHGLIDVNYPTDCSDKEFNYPLSYDVPDVPASIDLPFGSYVFEYKLGECEAFTFTLEVVPPAPTLALRSDTPPFCQDGSDRLIGLTVIPTTADIEVVSGAPASAIIPDSDGSAFNLNAIDANSFTNGVAQIVLIAKDADEVESEQLSFDVYKQLNYGISVNPIGVNPNDLYLYDDEDAQCSIKEKRVILRQSGNYANNFIWEIRTADGTLIPLLNILEDPSQNANSESITVRLPLAEGPVYQVSLQASIEGSPCNTEPLTIPITVCPTEEELNVQLAGGNSNLIRTQNQTDFSVGVEVSIQGGAFNLQLLDDQTPPMPVQSFPNLIVPQIGTPPNECKETTHTLDYSLLTLPTAGKYRITYFVRSEICGIISATTEFMIIDQDIEEIIVQSPLREDTSDEITNLVNKRAQVLSSDLSKIVSGSKLENTAAHEAVANFLIFEGLEQELNQRYEEVNKKLLAPAKRKRTAKVDKEIYLAMLKITAKHFLNMQSVVTAEEEIAAKTQATIAKAAKDLDAVGVDVKELRRAWKLKPVRDAVDNKRPSRIHKLFTI